MKPIKPYILLAFVLLATAALFPSCAPSPRHIPSPAPSPRKPAMRLGYCVQVGVFSRVENATHLVRRLQRLNIWAFYFKDSSGLYKVRFGNFPSRHSASKKAHYLKKRGIIADYYIVNPQPIAKLLSTQEGKTRLRNRIVSAAYSFVGLPYRWRGSSPAGGFDCSGLTMAVYRLNGLILPRSSYQQWMAGIPVSLRQLKKGDLVFFATSAPGKVSHVGIYVGKNKFIHAPGRGKKIEVESLNNPYFRRHFVGARRYI